MRGCSHGAVCSLAKSHHIDHIVREHLIFLSTFFHLSVHRATSGVSGTDTRTDERTLTLE